MIGESKTTKTNSLHRVNTNEDSEIDSRYNVEDFQILISSLHSYWNSPPEFIHSQIQDVVDTLKEFDQLFRDDVILPPPIFLQLHNYILSLLTQETIPEVLIEPTLDVLADIAPYLNDDFSQEFYETTLFPAIVRFFPSTHAIDAFASIIGEKLPAAEAFLSNHELFDQLLSFLNSSDNEQVQSSLSIILAIVSHREITHEKPLLISKLFKFITETDDNLLQSYAFDALNHAAKTDSGLAAIISTPCISDLLFSAKNHAFSDALSFLRRLAVSMAGNDPFSFFAKSGLIPYVMLAFDDPKNFFIGVGIIYALVADNNDSSEAAKFFAENGIFRALFKPESSQKNFFIGLRTICQICISYPPSSSFLFKENGSSDILDSIGEWLSSIDDQDFIVDMIKCIASTLSMPQAIEYYRDNDTILSALEELSADQKGIASQTAEVIYGKILKSLDISFA